MVYNKNEGLRRRGAKAALSALLSDELDPLFWEAARPDSESAWYGHIPFAHWLVRQVRPDVLVELGTHAGVSYSAFCSTVVREGLETRCFAVDTWKGDDHTGYYDGAIYDEFTHFNNENYGTFSTLLCKTFDEALADIGDRSVDLLHIDSFHSYEAVRHDFESWLPKLSDRAVAVFHDTNEYQEGFGVWKYWAELREQYPAFEFLHSHGLGVLCVGSKAADAVVSLCELDATAADYVRSRFEAAGDRWVQRAGHRTVQAHNAALVAENDRLRGKLAVQMAFVSKLVQNNGPNRKKSEE